MKSRQEIKASAKEALRAQYGTAVLLVVMYTLASIALNILNALVAASTSNEAVQLIVSLAGTCILFVIFINFIGENIKVYRREQASPGAVFSGMKVNFLRKLGGTVWMCILIFLWTLLLIIPGIIKMFSYYFTQFILADCPNVTANQAIKISMRITNGYKWDIFYFGLTFIGWMLLSILTLGLLYIFYVGPYFWAAFGGLYIELRDKAIADGRVTREELGMP